MALETMGVGYGFDRLYAVDLKTGKQIKLPSRYDITKMYARGDDVGGNSAEARIHSYYNGVKANSRISSSVPGIGDTGLLTGDFGRTALTFTTGTSAALVGSWNDAANDGMMLAYAGDGHTTKNQVKGEFEHYYVHPVCEEDQSAVIDFRILEKLSDGNNGKIEGNEAAALTLLYRHLSPSAWEAIEVNQAAIADFSKAVKDIERVMDAIYNRGRSHLGVRLPNSTTMKLIISLVELGAAIRSKRFSTNIHAINNSGWHSWEYYDFDGILHTFDEGVVNDFFMVFGDILVAPWWLVNSLNFYAFHEDEREKEQRDVERKDAIEALHMIFKNMDVEKGLHHGSDSTLPMILFEKYKEGVLKDFTQYKSAESAVAAALLGFRTPREADFMRKSTTAGTVPYFDTLPIAHGMLLGSEKAEFLDRINEASEHAMMASNPDGFKEGMQLASSFGYSAMLGQLRFGDAHLDYRVYPGGWFRGFQRNAKYQTTEAGTEKDNYILNIAWFPFLSWGQLYKGTSTEGFLPMGGNGAYYSRMPHEGPQMWTESNDTGNINLWPDNLAAGVNYWEPGREQYSALFLKGTDQLYQTWVDRTDTIATEGVTVPSFGSMNLIAEMSYDTPHAMVTRNFPYLRKLYQVAGTSVAPTSGDKAFDFLSAGDDVHDISQWRGSTAWKLRDRHLESLEAHPRNGELDLMSYTHVGKDLPESWVDVFQLRDWMMFHTSLESEPIMDSYSRSVQSTMFRNNGYSSSRLVVYVDETIEDGTIDDVSCTPIVGTFLLSEERLASLETNFSLNPQLSMFPSNNAARATYEMFLLDIDRVRDERVLSDGTRVGNALVLSTSLGSVTGLSEADFVPGRGYALRWVRENRKSSTPSTSLTWVELFGDTSGYENPTTSLGFYQAIRPTTDSGGNAVDWAGQLSEITLADGSSANTFLGAGTELTLSNRGLVYWVHKMGQLIEDAREGLEFVRASPMFTIFDKDILDSTEARFRQMLAPKMQSTVGPLTFVGTMTSAGEQHSSETITGDTRKEVISLSSGAGKSAMEESEPDAEDDAVGEENPSLSIAEKPEVE